MQNILVLVDEAKHIPKINSELETGCCRIQKRQNWDHNTCHDNYIKYCIEIELVPFSLGHTLYYST